MKIFSRLLTTIVLALAVTASIAKADGFRVQGSQLIDANGIPFLMRGINHPHAWYANLTEQSMADIAATKANVVRVVLSAGEPWVKTSADEVEFIIELAKRNSLIVMFEVHNTTGYGRQEGAMHLAETIPYWLSLRDVLAGEEAYVLINLGNEPTSSSIGTGAYVEMNIGVIKALRAAGLKHTFVVDGHNWAQDETGAMRENAPTIFAADPLKNTIFSVHMYQQYSQAEAIVSYFEAFNDAGLVLIVGEFGPDHQGKAVDEDTILRAARELDIGYIAWSWSGNSPPARELDLVLDFDPERLSPWGQRLIEGVDGIRSTSIPASVFD